MIATHHHYTIISNKIYLLLLLLLLLLLNCYKSDIQRSKKYFSETSQSKIPHCLSTTKPVHKDPGKVFPQIALWSVMSA